MTLPLLRLLDSVGIDSAKNLHIFISLIFSLSIFQSASAQNCSSNLLDNPGFEINFGNDWEGYGGTTFSNDANSGQRAVEIPSGFNRIFQFFPAQPGEEYTLSAYLKDNASGGAIGLKFLTAAYQPDNEFLGVSSNGAYFKAELTRTAPADAAWVEVSIFSSPNGAVLADDVCLTVGGGGNTSNCSLATNVNVTACNDRNTPDPSDDMYDFVVDVTPTNGGTGYTAEWFENGARRVFNRNYPIGIGQPFNLISTGTLTLTLTDNADPTCQTTVNVVPPAPCSGGTASNGSDLKLTATGSPATIGAWSFGSSTFTITNEGAQAVTGVEVSFDLHASAKLKGGDEYDASQGTLESFWTQVPVWNVGRLAPGQTETIQLNIFTLAGGMMPIYGQVSAASGNDPDSSPNNGNSPTPSEDDEAVFVFNGSGNPIQQADLRLSNLSISNQPSAGEVLNYNFNVINSGTATATGNYNVKAYISTDNVLSNDDIQDGIVPTGNTTVGTISGVPGASTLPSNLPQGNYYLILKIDADDQITESNEGNNTVAVPFSIGGVALPDLIVENVTSRSGSQIFIGQGVSAFFDGVNLGEPVPFSSFPLIYGLYLSTDRVLDANDVFILDLGLGQGPGLQFGGQVPPSLAPGDYYLIVETDFPNNIQESNEGNNWTASTQTVEAVPVGNSCAFVKTYDTNGVETPSVNSNYSFIENASGYEVGTTFTSFSPRTTVTRTYALDLNGNVQSLTDSPFTSSTDQTVALEVDADENLEMVFGVGSDLPVGTRVLVDVGNPNPTSIIEPSFAYRMASGGYAFGLGIVDVTQSPNIKNIVIKTDNLGQNVQIIDFPNPDFYTGFLPVIEGADGSLFFTLGTSGNLSLYGIPAGSSTAWNYRVASDTPSTTWRYTQLSKDGNFIYTAKTDNQQTVIAKMDVQTGTPTLIDLSSLKAPSPGGNFRQNRVHGIIPTSDGGLLMSMSFSEVTGNPRLTGEIIAKIDAIGNIVWSQEFNSPQFDISLTPAGETSDGGGLFIGTNGRGTNDTADDAAIFVKTTDVGALNPICVGGSTDGVDLELSFAPLADPSPSQWGFFGVTLTITNSGTEAATGVQVNFKKADEVTYKGGDEFSASQGDFQYWGNENWTVGNLAAGETATLDVNYFRLSASPFTAFAEISAMNEADADSTPGNGTCCTAIEDDEAAVAIGSGSARSVGGRTLLEENISAREGFAILNAAPNPFSNQMTLNVYSHESQSSEVLIYDVLGRSVLRQAVDLTEGHNSISIDASDLPVGFLTVKMSPEHRYLRQVRVVKVRE